MNAVTTEFEQMYNATYDNVSFYVLTKCGRIPEAEDILQETYAELFRVLKEKGAAYILVPEAFVMQLAKSKVFYYYGDKERRRAGSYAEISDTDNAGEWAYAACEEDWQDALVDKLTAEEVMAYLAEKDALTREIFYQRYFQDKTLKEIAKSCGVKETTVKNHLYRTLQELRGMKRFALIAAILLLTALLAKPVCTWAGELITRAKGFWQKQSTWDVVALGSAYRSFKEHIESGVVDETVPITVNGVVYSFAELEKIWLDNPWLEELDWESEGKDGDVDTFYGVNQDKQ